MRKYSKIIVMDGARIVERGSFDELMGREGAFHRLYKVLEE